MSNVIRLPYARVFEKATPASFGRIMKILEADTRRQIEDASAEKNRKIAEQLAERRKLNWSKYFAPELGGPTDAA